LDLSLDKGFDLGFDSGEDLGLGEGFDSGEDLGLSFGSDLGFNLELRRLLDDIDSRLSHSERVVVAIDGMAAAGKSSLSARMSELYSCSVIHMDHFFLRPKQRTSERFAEIGGNVDYERFASEVLEPLASGKPFSYRPYDCKTGELSEPVTVAASRLIVVEGVYSLHPKFFTQTYDICVFLQISEKEQRRRLSERNPALYERFLSEWVPLENKYFEHFKIREKCDYVLEELYL